MNKVELLQKAKQILFNTEMVQAILENKKTVTRRIVKNAEIEIKNNYVTIQGLDRYGEHIDNDNCGFPYTNNEEITRYMNGNYAPYEIGDILYVRETWQEVFETEYGRDRPFNIRELITNFDEIDKIKAGLSTECSRPGDPAREKYYVFRASNICYADSEDCLRWKPSIHMPRKAARIFLKVKDVYVERLQEISNWDIKHEGLPYSEEKINFIELWNSTIKKQDFKKYSWDANPWVWVIEFEKVEIGDE